MGFIAVILEWLFVPFNITGQHSKPPDGWHSQVMGTKRKGLQQNPGYFCMVSFVYLFLFLSLGT